MKNVGVTEEKSLLLYFIGTRERKAPSQKRPHTLLSFQNLLSFPQESLEKGIQEKRPFSTMEFLHFAILPLLLQVFCFYLFIIKVIIVTIRILIKFYKIFWFVISSLSRAFDKLKI